MYCGVIITTNHLSNGIYIPADDRRYDVIEAATMEEMGIEDEVKRKEYFGMLWEWFTAGGAPHVAAYLHERSLEKFSPNSGQRKSKAHEHVVAEGMSVDAWLMDVLDELEWPDVVTADKLKAMCVANGEKEMDIRRKLSNSIGRCNYVTLKNPDRKDGRWSIGDEKRKFMVYVKCGVAISDAFKQISKLNAENF
jgi:hypothetical protein